MSQAESSQQPAFEQASTKLNQGLKSCRSVIQNYRSLLGAAGGRGEPSGGAPGAQNDNPD